MEKQNWYKKVLKRRKQGDVNQSLRGKQTKVGLQIQEGMIP